MSNVSRRTSVSVEVPLVAMETAPVWWQTAPPHETGPRLRGDERAALVIVGGGLSGLATAYHVNRLDPDRRVVVLEAQRVGWGATGRSTGVVGPGLSMPMPRVRRKYGDAAAVEAFAASRHGVALLRELVAREGIECDARDEPHTVAALTEAQQRRMAKQLNSLGDLGFDVPWLSDAELTELAGPGYLAGFAYRDALLVDPYRLVTGLADVLRARGVEIYEDSPVLDVDTSGRRPVVRTPSGTVTAGRLLFTIDGYAKGLNPHPRSVFAIRTHVLATAPLTESQRAALGWAGRGGVIDQRNFFNYYRMTGDGRLVFGGGPAVVPSGDPTRDAAASTKVYRRLHRELSACFPVLADVEVDAYWSGLTASSFDRLPVLGSVPGQSAVHYAGSWCGHGLSLCVDAGWRFAKSLLDDPEPGLLWERDKAPGVPSSVLRSKGSRAYLRFLDRADRRDLRRLPDAALETVGR